MPRQRHLSPETRASLEYLADSIIANAAADAFARKTAFELSELNDHAAAIEVQQLAKELSRIMPRDTVSDALVIGFEARVAEWRRVLKQMERAQWPN